MRNWHLRILTTDWVVWGYGPPGGVKFIARAVINCGQGIEFDFELPEHRPGSSLPPAQVYERVRGVAWRIESKNGEITYWKLATSEDEAVIDAMAYAGSPHMRHDTRDHLMEAIKDVRRETV